VLTEAIAQIPDPHRRDLLITVDGAGATLELIRRPTGGATNSWPPTPPAGNWTSWKPTIAPMPASRTGCFSAGQALWRRLIPRVCAAQKLMR